MDPVLILFATFVILLIVGVPFTWSMLLSVMASVALTGQGTSAQFFANKMYAGGAKYTLLAVFFFLLAGAIMQHGGISKRLIDCARAWVGHLHGGLSIVVILCCMFFAAISGSAIATTCAIGGMLYPELVKEGYPKPYSAALPVVGGTLGTVIPPSIAFVVFGSTLNVSVGDLLISGLVPGILGGLALCVYAFVVAKRKHFPKSNSFDFKNALLKTKDAFWALAMPVIIMGGIYSGKFTPTESAAIAVFYGLIVSVFIYRELSMKKLLVIVLESVKTNANCLMLIMSAMVFSWAMTVYKVPDLFMGAMLSVINNKITFLLAMNVLLIILGMLMETSAIILIVGPLLYPVAMQFGIDPVHLGCIMVFNLAVGQATPPFGTCLFAGSTTMGESVVTLSKAVIPLIVIEFAVVFLITFVEPLALGLVALA
jgi:C4-dicarboxylate transporter DctM subunit